MLFISLSCSGPSGKAPPRCKSIGLISCLQFARSDNNQIDLHLRYVEYDLPGRLCAIPKLRPTIRSGDEKEYMQVLCNNQSSRGYLFNPAGAAKPIEISLDSFLNIRAFKNFPFYNENNDSLVESIPDKENQQLIEKHIFKHKKDQSYSDSVYYYFDNALNDIDYSFSKKLDSAKNRKLYKVRIIYNIIRKGNKGMDIPRREFSFEIQKTGNCSPEVIDLCIEGVWGKTTQLNNYMIPVRTILINFYRPFRISLILL